MLLDMEANGPEPNIYTYNNIVRVFAEVGKLDEALSMLMNIKKHQLVPDRYTFTTLLMACGRANNDDNTRAESVQQIMDLMRDCGVLPDAIAYGAAMDAYRWVTGSILSCCYFLICFAFAFESPWKSIAMTSWSYWNCLASALQLLGDCYTVVLQSL
jgi:pentatricopeptide repeat protein